MHDDESLDGYCGANPNDARDVLARRHPDPCPACKGTGEGSAGDCPCAECMKRPTYRDHSINP